MKLHSLTSAAGYPSGCGSIFCAFSIHLRLSAGRSCWQADYCVRQADVPVLFCEFGHQADLPTLFGYGQGLIYTYMTGHSKCSGPKLDWIGLSIGTIDSRCMSREWGSGRGKCGKCSGMGRKQRISFASRLRQACNVSFVRRAFTSSSYTFNVSTPNSHFDIAESAVVKHSPTQAEINDLQRR